METATLLATSGGSPGPAAAPAAAPPSVPPPPAPPPVVELELDAAARQPQPALHAAALPAFLALGRSLVEDGHEREAEAIFHRVLATDARHVEALHELGLLHLRRGESARAIEILEQAIDSERRAPALWLHLGESYRAVRRLDEAEHCLQAALALAPGDPDTLCNLGHVHVQQGRLEDAAQRYEDALTRLPDHTALLTFLGAVRTYQGADDEAADCYERAATVDPANDTARHLLAALRREAVTTVPRAYVVDLFDNYADSFDEHLVHTLRYTAPQRIHRAVTEIAAPPPAGWRVMDLGCGTGLCGAALRPLARELIGVDLSPRMVHRARQRSIYDRLDVGDAVAGLDRERTPLDLIVAGDVLLYIGDLAPLMRAAARSLRQGGLFAFTTERCAEDGFAIQATGRFAHADAYIRETATGHGFGVARAGNLTVRVEQGRPIAGQLFVLRRD